MQFGIELSSAKKKTWILIVETISYQNLSCYRKILFITAPDPHHAKEKARNWCEGEQITSIIAIPFDPSRMGDALIDSTVKKLSEKPYNIEEGEDY